MKRLIWLVFPAVFAALSLEAAEPASIAVPGFTLWTVEQPRRITEHEYETHTPGALTRYQRREVELPKELLKEIELPVLTDIFIRKLVGSGKFTVVERAKADVLLGETERAKEGPHERSAVAKKGGALGVQYVALGTLTYAARDVELKPVAYTGRTHRIERGEIRVDLRILEVPTGRIVASVPGQGRLERRIDEDTLEPRPLPGSFIADLQEELAHDLMVRTVDALYPFKVISVKGGTAFADRGENFRIQKGEVYEVLRRGEPVIDPDTKEMIAFDEEVLDRVTVTGVFQKACRLETGNTASGVRPGDILRSTGAASP